MKLRILQLLNHTKTFNQINLFKKLESFNDKIKISLLKRHKFNKGTTMFKCVNDLAPINLTSMFSSKNERDQSKLYVPLPRIDLFKSSLKFSGATIWNSLPPELHKTESLSTFKNKLYAILLENP